jgi:hypothetical protein
MNPWPASKCFARIGDAVAKGLGHQRQTGSHRVLKRYGYPDFVFAFHEAMKSGLA